MVGLSTTRSVVMMLHEVPSWYSHDSNSEWLLVAFEGDLVQCGSKDSSGGRRRQDGLVCHRQLHVLKRH